jgi:hypothetical protein
MKVVLSLLFCSMILMTFGQEDKKKIIDSNLIQLSGVVISEETLEPLPYTTVFDKTQRRGVIADYYGFFSMVAMPGDTLLFSFYGHKTSSYIVPDSLTDNRYSMIHMVQKDTLNLPQVDVYPWPSREDFARAFIDMEPYDDALRRAQQQLSGESLAFVAARLEGDASLSYTASRNAYNTKLYTNGQLPGNNLLNPYAWSKLIKDWKEGKLSRE